MIFKYLALFALSYVIGSLSLSIIVSGGLFGKDIRSFGSGNAGATNMARVFGWSAGILTLVGNKKISNSWRTRRGQRPCR